MATGEAGIRHGARIAMLALVVCLMPRSAAATACGKAPGDAAAVAATRAALTVQCDCAAAATHGIYLRCAKRVIDTAVSAGTLSSSCAASVKRCASRSICGRSAGFVTCCRTTSRGTRCSIKSDASKCRAPLGGSACTGVESSCCDACGATGCAPASTPTPSSSATITTTPTSTRTPSVTPTVTVTPTIPPICHADVPLPALAQVPFTIAQGSSTCGGVGLTNPAPAPPFSGTVTDAEGGVLAELGAGCLYAGGVPGLRLPDGAEAKLDVVGISLLPPSVTLAGSAGSGPFDCTKGAGPGRNCVNGAPGTDGTGTCEFDDDCGAAGTCVLRANCFFGPPIPLAFGPLGTCVVNAFLTDLCGSVSLLPPSASLSTALEARVFLTGDLASPCPRCEGGLCNSGDRIGQACTPVGSQGTTLECPPAASTYLSSLRVILPELTTGTSSLQADDGVFCPGQTVAGAFGIPGAREVSQTGVAPGGGASVLDMTLAGTFCLPSANPLFDVVAQIPGVGAVAAKGTLDLSGVLP